MEPPLILRVLAISLRPTAILLICALALGASLTHRKALARALSRVAAAQALVLVGAVLAFGMAALALALTSLNPTPVLKATPLGRALLGPLALVVGWRFSGVERGNGWRALLGRAVEPKRRMARVVQIGLLVVVLASSLVVGGRSLTNNSSTSLVELAYDLFEYAVPDQIVKLASDECLIARVLEYGIYDQYQAGQDAVAELEARGSSAVAGVASTLNQARQRWPPQPNTLKPGTIGWGLEFIRAHGEKSQADAWNGISWESDLHRLNTYRPRAEAWRY